ncbi:MAG: LysE family translocator [Alphaproteobacteria bacterium]
MPDLQTLIGFTLAALAMNLSPGPSNLYVMSRSIAQGAAAGAVAAGGLAAGSLVHVLAAAFGVSTIFRHAPDAFAVLKFAGAAYLIYLGIRHLLAMRRPVDAAPVVAARTRRRIFRESVTVEVLNPKTALFFLALLPQFVDPAAGPVAPQMLVLGLIVTLSAVPCDLAVAFAAGRAARLLSASALFQRLQQAISGTILIGLGVFVAVARRQA